ncbi:MAG: sugar ABC transporter ATP-binding protein [Armatimonadota bacterium]|nr:sugar ABC transporter ATP-binding protein [Armatimonadota bacterium]
MSSIVKDFPGVRAVDHVDLFVRRGEVHGLIGENGAGKSTLMKILGGVYSDYEGEIFVDGVRVRIRSPRESIAAGIAVIHQELNLVPQLSVAENIFLGREPLKFFFFVDFTRMNRMAEELLSPFDPTIAPRTPVGELSVGRQQLVEIVRALSLNARILVMDEPTSALTEAEVEKLFEVIRRLKVSGTTIIYITHKLKEVLTITDRVTVMRDGKVVGTVNTSEADHRMLARMMVGREIEEAKREVAGYGAVVLSARNLSLLSRETPGKRILNNISFDLRSGEVVGIFGLMGAGRTELMLTLFGSPPGIAYGEIKLDGKPIKLRSPIDAIRHGIGLVTEDRKTTGLILMMAAGYNATLPLLPSLSFVNFIKRRRERELIERLWSKLQIVPRNPSMPAQNLSGGNQQKVVLSKWLAMRPKVLLLDEPTRGVDVGARAEIHKLIREMAMGGAAILFASSELPEVLSLADRILVMHAGQIVHELKAEGATEEEIMFYASGAHALEER